MKPFLYSYLFQFFSIINNKVVCIFVYILYLLYSSVPHLKKFYWSIVDYNIVLTSSLQQSDSVIHTHTPRYVYILFHYGLSQDIEYSSLCYTVLPCGLSIFYITVSICWFQTPSPTLLSLPPLWQPQVCTLCLWVCFYFIDKWKWKC